MDQRFTVQGMRCGHCVAAVTRAIQAVDPHAEVKVDLGSAQVEVDSQREREQIAQAIRAKGYEVTP